MARAHEDRERHALVDHRPGGSPISFACGSWLVIGVARMKSGRGDAGVAAYETLVEKARSSNVHAGAAAVFISHNQRRVVTIIGVRGHDGFRHLSAAWDDHHRFEQHRAVAESVSLGLYQVARSIADPTIDASSHDAFIYESVERTVPKNSELFASNLESPAFGGATIFQGDDGGASVVLFRFAHLADYEVFRAGQAAQDALGAEDQTGATSFLVHPAKTFASP